MNCKKRLCAALLALMPFTAFSQTAVNAPAAPVVTAADKSVTNAPAAAVQDKKQICDTLKKSIPREARYSGRVGFGYAC